MSSLEDIKRRMKGIRQIHQITRAMEMVSAAKLHKAESNLKILAQRYKTLRRILTGKLKNLQEVDAPSIIKRSKSKKTVYVLISSNKGLCGAFNKNVFRFFKSLGGRSDISTFIVGRKIMPFMERENYSIKGKFLFPDKDYFYKFSHNLVLELLDSFKKGTIDTVKVIFNRNISPIEQKTEFEELMPIVPTDEELDESEQLKHLCEPSDYVFLKEIAVESIMAGLAYILAQSEVAEHTARASAMKSASDNASDLLDELMLSYNKARQAAITKEIIEVANAAEALKGDTYVAR